MRVWIKNRKFVILIGLVILAVSALGIIITTNIKNKVTSVSTTTPNTLHMEIGKSYTIKTKVLPSNASNKNLIFTTSDQKIVKITSKGKVTALKIGTTTVTVKAANGIGKKATYRFKVIVKKPSRVLNFTSKDNYHSYMYVNIVLPAGVTTTDLTSIGFDVITKKDLSIRLYAGNGSVTKSDSNELTCEEKNYKIIDTEDVIDNNTGVKKIKHTLVDNIKKSTRIAVKAGNDQKVTFKVEDHAKKVLSNYKGIVLTLGIYAHNIAPDYSIYNLQIKTASKTYDVKLDSLNIGGLDNGTVTIQ